MPGMASGDGAFGPLKQVWFLTVRFLLYLWPSKIIRRATAPAAVRRWAGDGLRSDDRSDVIRLLLE